MANYNNLKSAIQSVIKANGNNEITGPILQAELLSMINTLGAGYQFIDVATPTTNPGTPDARVMYLAYIAGTYVNFGGITVTGFCVLKYDITWTKTDIPISSGGRDFVTEPDDLTIDDSSGENVLKFANRFYSPSNPNGLGYIIIREDDTLASQMIYENTIYEIRHNWDLDGKTLNIPAGCVLKFNGGKFANGTLNGDFSIEAGLVKIFSNVKFQGNCENNEVELDWFVANKMDSCILDGTQLDATAEIQDAFNSKATKVHISNKFFYYITDTISVNSWQTITGTPQSNGIQRMPTNAVPSIYTDTDCIMMIVYANSDNNTKMMRRINIENLYLRRYASFTSDNFKDNIPMLKLTNSPLTQTMTYNNVWGCNLKVFLFSADRQIEIDVNGVTKNAWMRGFLGLEIDVTNGGFYTYIVINGDITGFRKAVYTHVTNGWMTDIRCLCDTDGTFGGELNGSPVRIGGSHQTTQDLVDNTNAAYFTLSSAIGISDAMIWDLGNTDTTGLKAVDYAFNAPAGFVDLINHKQNTVLSSIPVKIAGEPILPINSGDLYRFFSEMFRMLGFDRNLLEQRHNNVIGRALLGDELFAIYPTTSRDAGIFTKLAVVNSSTNDEIALSKDNVQNFSHLFKVSGSVANNIGSLGNIFIDEAVLSSDISSSYDRYVVVFEINSVIAQTYFLRGSYIGFVKRATDFSQNDVITIEYVNSSDVVVKTETISARQDVIYYTRCIYSDLLFDNSISCSKYRITFNIGLSGSVSSGRVMPKAFMNSVSLSNNLTQSGGEIPGKSVFGELYGMNYKTNPLSGFRCWNDPRINRSFLANTNPSLYTDAICIGVMNKAKFYLKLTDEKGRQSVLFVNPATGEGFTDSQNFVFRIKTISSSGASNNKVLIGVQTTDSSIRNFSIDYIHAFEKFVLYDSIVDSGYDTTNYVYPLCATTAKRPTSPAIGACFFDTTLGKPIWWNGSAWVDSTGASV